MAKRKPEEMQQHQEIETPKAIDPKSQIEYVTIKVPVFTGDRGSRICYDFYSRLEQQEAAMAARVITAGALLYPRFPMQACGEYIFRSVIDALPRKLD